MTATLPDIDLDAILGKDRPCEALDDGKPVCQAPAEWAIRALCGACGKYGLDLVCTRHKNLIATNPYVVFTCPHCGAHDVTSIEVTRL